MAKHLIFLFIWLPLTVLAAPKASSSRSHFTELGLGINASHFRYDEELKPPLKSSEEASFGMLLLEGKVFLSQGFFIKGRYEMIEKADSQYDGTTQSGTPVLSTDKLSFWTYELDLYIPVDEQLHLFVGYGSRKWDRLLVGGSTYREIYSWNFMPVGIWWKFWQVDLFSGGVEASFRQMLGGKIKIITSEFNTGGQNSEMDLGNKPGYKLAFPVRLQATPTFSVMVTPWYEHSEIGESNVVPNATLSPTPGTGIMEPASKTDQYGVEGILQILL